MTLQQAQKVLIAYNKWRRHEGEPYRFEYSGLELGAAIDLAVHSMWRLEKIQNIVYFGEGKEENVRQL